MANHPPTTPAPSTCPAGQVPAAVPLAVWPVAQTSAQYQRAGRYHPGCTAHPAKMLPDLARRIIATYSEPGDLVVDPMCGVGTTILEAAALGRRGVGVELEARWADLAQANLAFALTGSQARLAEIRVGDATALPHLLADLVGKADLVCTSPPYGCDAGVIDKPAWLAGGRLCPASTLNYSPDRDNVGHHRGQRYAASMAAVYAGCYQLLRPGGLLVTVTKNTRRSGRTLDLAGLTVSVATEAGFAYLQHVIALHAAVRDSALVARPSFWQLTQTRQARSRGEPTHLVVHEDVEVFQRLTRVENGGVAAHGV
jgi:modification methylase